MSSIPEQIALAAQARMASQLTVVNALSNLALGGIEKLIKLNFDTVKQSLEHSTASTQQWMSAQQPQDFLSLAAARGAPQLEEILSYGRELASISGLARTEFLQALGGLNPLAELVQVAPDAVHIQVTAPVLSAALQPVENSTKAKAKNKTSVATPLVKKPKTKPEAKNLKANDSQMSLLAATDKKVGAITKTPAKAETVNPLPTPSATKPTTTLATPVKPATAKPVSKKPAAAKPVTKAKTATIETKPLLEKSLNTELPLATAETKPASEPVLEKKTAVKFPFPANPKKPGSKPAFPANNSRPGYKAKGSAATGAKKPVRQ